VFDAVCRKYGIVRSRTSNEPGGAPGCDPPARRLNSTYDCLECAGRDALAAFCRVPSLETAIPAPKRGLWTTARAVDVARASRRDPVLSRGVVALAGQWPGVGVARGATAVILRFSGREVVAVARGASADSLLRSVWIGEIASCC